MADRAWLVGELAVSRAQGKGNEGRGYGLRTAVHVITGVTASCSEVGTHQRARANACSVPAHGEAASPSGTAVPLSC